MAAINKLGEGVCAHIIDRLRGERLWVGYTPDFGPRTHLVSPTPFDLSKSQIDCLDKLGNALLSFYKAADSLYIKSDHPWVCDYLDRGKPEYIVKHSRMNYHKRSLPNIIRPDILLVPGDPGFAITELDSVPGGFGHLDCLSSAYADSGFRLVGSCGGISGALADMFRESAGKDDPACAIIVSQESADYFPEMDYISRRLRQTGLAAYTVRPEEIVFTEEGLYIDTDDGRIKLDVIYRFYELFDLPNIPKSELIAYAAKKRLVVVTPPYKHHLEEKMLLALLHMESLAGYWAKEMGEEDFGLLRRIVIPTYILDNRPVPPHARISGFDFGGLPVRDWMEIVGGTQKQRRLVVKPSGFSPIAWGSRGVRIGHDMPRDEWERAVAVALDEFDNSPWVLQEYVDTDLIGVSCFQEECGETCEMQARIRLCPYYFVRDDKAEPAGVLSTACPKNKKLIHGMADAVISPCRMIEK